MSTTYLTDAEKQELLTWVRNQKSGGSGYTPEFQKRLNATLALDPTSAFATEFRLLNGAEQMRLDEELKKKIEDDAKRQAAADAKWCNTGNFGDDLLCGLGLPFKWIGDGLGGLLGSTGLGGVLKSILSLLLPLLLLGGALYLGFKVVGGLIRRQQVQNAAKRAQQMAAAAIPPQ